MGVRHDLNSKLQSQSSHIVGRGIVYNKHKTYVNGRGFMDIVKPFATHVISNIDKYKSALDAGTSAVNLAKSVYSLKRDIDEINDIKQLKQQLMNNVQPMQDDSDEKRKKIKKIIKELKIGSGFKNV